MLIKRGKVDIIEVVEDQDHNIDDLGTREALNKTKEELLKKGDDKTKTLEN